MTTAKKAIYDKKNKIRGIDNYVDKQVYKNVMNNGRRNISIREIFAKRKKEN